MSEVKQRWGEEVEAQGMRIQNASGLSTHTEIKEMVFSFLCEKLGGFFLFVFFC